MNNNTFQPTSTRDMGKAREICLKHGARCRSIDEMNDRIARIFRDERFDEMDASLLSSWVLEGYTKLADDTLTARALEVANN